MRRKFNLQMNLFTTITLNLRDAVFAEKRRVSPSHLRVCLFFLVLLPATVLAQTLENSG